MCGASIRTRTRARLTILSCACAGTLKGIHRNRGTCSPSAVLATASFLDLRREPLVRLRTSVKAYKDLLRRTRSALQLFALRVAAESIHATELVCRFTPPNHVLRGLHAHPPILAAVFHYFRRAVPRAASILFFFDERAVILLHEVAFRPDISETFAMVHVAQDQVAALYIQLRNRLQNFYAVRLPRNVDAGFSSDDLPFVQIREHSAPLLPGRKQLRITAYDPFSERASLKRARAFVHHRQRRFRHRAPIDLGLTRSVCRDEQATQQ